MKYIIYSLVLIFVNISLYGQCADPDATIWKDTWSSCEMSANPIAEYGLSHWVMFDLGEIKQLSNTWIWNTNDPEKLDQGFDLCKIDYSADGKEWTHWGEMNFPKAEGNAVYGGFSGPNLQGVEAKHVLLTAVSNHGHTSCMGLAEVKFNLSPKQQKEVVCVVDPVTDFGTSRVDSSSASIFWNSADACNSDCGHWVEYRLQGDAKWLVAKKGKELSLVIEGLEPGNTYEYRIGTNKSCSSDLIYSEIKLFTTSDSTTNVLNLDEDKPILLFPNPTNAFVNIQTEKLLYREYKILDGVGVVVESGILQDKLTRVNLAEYPSGIYFIKIWDQFMRLVKW